MREEDTAVKALKSGADDDRPEALRPREDEDARVTNAMRRSGASKRRLEVVVTGEVEINLPERQVRSVGAEARLRRKPFGVLSILAEKAGQVIASQTILRAVWGQDSVDEWNTYALQYATCAVSWNLIRLVLGTF